MALDPAELRVAEPLVPEAGHEDPLQRLRSPLEFREALFVGVVSPSFATNGGLDLVASVDDGLQDVDEIPALVTDRVAESGDVVAVAMTLAPDHVRRDVSRTDDVRIQTREIEFVDVVVDSDVRREDESAPVGVVERAHRLVELVAPGVPRHQYAAVAGFADLDRGEDVPDRRPGEFLNGLLRARDEIEDTETMMRTRSGTGRSGYSEGQMSSPVLVGFLLSRRE